MAAAGEFGTASARTLADILAEAGIEATGRGGRRRRSEPDPTDTAEVSGPEPAEAEPVGVDSAEAEIDAAEQARSEPEGETLVVPGQPLPRSRGRHGPPARAPAPEGSAARGWSLLIVEVVLVAFLGVLLWYGFSVLWELYPYAAAVAAPGVLAGIVGVGQLLRARRGLPPLPGPVVFALLLVGAVLAVLPAAAVLARS